jgi:hypothetical protein
MVKFGDTFVWDPNGGNNPHLWIVLTPPDKNGQCVIINLTTSSHGKHSMILKTGDHPYIRHDSDVNFGDSFISSESQIAGALKSREAVANQPLNQTFLNQIITAAKAHPAPPRAVRKMIADNWN